MFAHKKIVKEKGAEPETFELDVAQARPPSPLAAPRRAASASPCESAWCAARRPPAEATEAQHRRWLLAAWASAADCSIGWAPACGQRRCCW